MTDFFNDAIKDMQEHTIDDESDIAGEEWDPTAAGQALRGYFSKATPKGTQYGPGYTVVIKDHDTGEYVKVWCKRKMLMDQLLDASPKVGTPVVFVYNGEKEGSRNSYHSYQVRAEESDPEYWTDMTRKAVKAQEEYNARQAAPIAVTQGPIDGPEEAPY
jgi:hypothetical protein